MKNHIQNKKTKEKFVVLGFLAEMAQSYCVVASLNSKEITNLLLRELIKNYESLN